MPVTALLAQLQQWQQQAARLHIRLPVIWQGKEDALLSHTTALLSKVGYDKLYWLGAGAPADAVNLTGKQNYQLLGSECDVLVINAFSGFNVDLVAASAGCVKAGGIWLLLCPPFAKWQQQANPAHKNLLPYPVDAAEHQGHFVAFWLQQLTQQNAVVIEGGQISRQLSWPAAAPLTFVAAPYISAEQQTAVESILHVVSGHRRRPLVITADRGRGKSAALGIAASQLASSGKQIIITAPSPQAAQTALQHFQQLTDAAQHQLLQFVPFDQLLCSNNSVDLLLVDEAAAIPTPVLQQLLARFSRIVFATTEHGYEGTGRGFQLRFQQHLTTQCPGWKKLQLQQPVRYQAADPLEQLIFAGFLLQQPVDEPTYTGNAAQNVGHYKAADWLSTPLKLQQVFHLLSQAHYQTQVKDLAALLDNPMQQVITLEQHDQVLACALISIEGALSPELATAVYHGERRVQGHLLAQSLAFHLAEPQLASLALWRVMRISVHPALQRQQLGNQLLRYIKQAAQQAGVAYLGTSFGATAGLLQFWQQAGYTPVRLGSSSDKASAEYSILMLQAVTAPVEICQRLQQSFSAALYSNLPLLYPQLSAELAIALATPPQLPALSTAELEQLKLFSEGKRPFALVSHLLLSWFNLHYQRLPAELSQLLCALLWQGRSWPQLLQQSGLNSKQSCIDAIATQLAANGL
ncbi:tRNA(Met) cytidine acetyltransferase [Rheinheimera sp. YQF-2]|uniref:tRNA(Met) cytidine acetyltransferase TmcA n=1 Tax=Rheinheimera lutimaris TaxID=2740584 RepID=A0A7Y5AUZ7_9GAMM|nr:GNAT family N-acetyltransferase [Rheinheimera lutimaris]NRQ44435.1 tRNA(Met) cytidine acetyltransferase [Rheinheimera lutimaris]